MSGAITYVSSPKVASTSMGLSQLKLRVTFYQFKMSEMME